MNMNMRKVLFGLTLICSILFFGCKHNVIEYLDDEPEAVAENPVDLTDSPSNLDNLIVDPENVSDDVSYISLNFGDLERTIFPTVELSMLTNMTLTYGTNGNEYTVFEGVEYVDISGVFFAVYSGTWKFILTAQKDEIVYGAEINDKEISTGSNQLSFTLSIIARDNPMLSTLVGEGNINISVTVPQDKGINKCVAGLRYLGGSFDYVGLEWDYDNEEWNRGKFAPIELTNPVNGKWTYVLEDVPAGDYVVEFYFLHTMEYSQNDRGIATPEAFEAADSILGNYREVIYISNGCTTTADRTLNKIDDLFNVNYHMPDGGHVKARITYSRADFNSDVPQYETAYIRLPVDCDEGDVYCFKRGYHLEGWYKDSDFTQRINTNYYYYPQPGEGDIDLYAHFVINSNRCNGYDSSIINKLGLWGQITGEESASWKELNCISEQNYYFSLSEDNKYKEILTSPYYIVGPKSYADTLSITTSNITNFPIIYTGQSQTANRTLEAFKNFDYIVGQGIDIQKYGDRNISNMRMVGTRVSFTINGATSQKAYKQMVLYVPGAKFPVRGSINLAGNSNSGYSHDYNYDAEHFIMALGDSNGISAENNQIVINAVLPPGVNLNNMPITLVDTDNEYYVAYTPSNAGSTVAGTPKSFTVTAAYLPHYSGRIYGNHKMATHNVGAYSPEDPGKFFAYSEISSALSSDSVFSSPAGEGYVWELMSYVQAEYISSLDSIVSLSNENSHGVNGKQINSFDTNAQEVALCAGGYNGYAWNSTQSKWEILSFNAEGNYWINSDSECPTGEAYSLYVGSIGVGVTTSPKTEKFNIRPMFEEEN